MTVRLALVALALVAGAVHVGSARASYEPALVAGGTTAKLGAAGVRIKFSQLFQDEPTATIAVYVPQGYKVTTTAARGARIGNVTASFVSSDLKRRITSRGALTVVSASEAASASSACTGTTTHTAYWALNLTVGGTPLRVPAFVDAPAPGAPFAAAKITMCMPSPDLPVGSPTRAPHGSRLLSLNLSTKSIANPTSQGTYRWRATAAPFAANGKANTARSVEIQSLVHMPLEMSLTATVADSTRRGFSRITLSGFFRAGGEGIAGVSVVLLRGTRAGNLKKFGVLTTTGTGSFKSQGDVRKTRSPQRIFFAATTTAIEKDLGASGCEASFRPIPCIDATLPYSITSRPASITIPAA
ncbi:MAG: hypothetical protein ABR521_08365 [Gaiellaceae bacterium]